jgi:hypothetical protein
MLRHGERKLYTSILSLNPLMLMPSLGRQHVCCALPTCAHTLHTSVVLVQEPLIHTCALSQTCACFPTLLCSHFFTSSHWRLAGAPDSHLRTEILDEDQLLALFEERAAKAVASAGPNDPRAKEQGRRYMVGGLGHILVCHVRWDSVINCFM